MNPIPTQVPFLMRGFNRISEPWNRWFQDLSNKSGGGGGGSLNRVSKTSNYGVVNGDNGTFFDCSNTMTITLNSAASAGNNFYIEIYNSGTGWVTVPCNGSDTMLGLFGTISRYRLEPKMGIGLLCTGTGWEITKRMHTLIPPCELFLSTYTKGGIYDVRDFSTLFQDHAGTTPVTAVGQSVGLIKDISGLGHDFGQATSSLMPALGQDSAGNYYINFLVSSTARYWDAVGGAVFSSNEFTIAAGIYSSVSTNQRFIDTRGTGTSGTVKGWSLYASNTSSNIAYVDDGSGNYSYLTDPGFFPDPNGGYLQGPLIFSYGMSLGIFSARFLSNISGSTWPSGVLYYQSGGGGTKAPSSNTSTNTTRIGTDLTGATQSWEGKLFGNLVVIPAHTPHGPKLETLYSFILNTMSLP